MQLRDSIIREILKDKTRAKTIFTALTLAIIGGLLTRAAGIQLSAETNILITTAVTAAIGWIIEGWASDQNAKGGAKLQAVLQQQDPTLEIDGHIGDQTIAAAEDLVTAQTNEAPTKPADLRRAPGTEPLG